MEPGPGRPRGDAGNEPLLTISVQMPRAMIDRLDARAKTLGVSRQALLRAIVRRYGDRDVQFAL